MAARYHRISSKIVGILVIFTLAAITAIGMTLVVSWQLEGAAAAINDAGSQRMRSYRIGYLLSRDARESAPSARHSDEVRAEMERFEHVLADLEKGDPARPLFLPNEAAILEKAGAVRAAWQTDVRPLVAGYLDPANSARRPAMAARYDEVVAPFVATINDLVLLMEQSYARNTNALRSFQLALVALALGGTVLLIRYFFVVVIRPLGEMRAGIQRMTREDFSVRVPIKSKDEFGDLADGFNQMAGHLENLYATLEERVETKTRSLAQKNHELAMLYDVAAFLNEPASTEELCRGFLLRVRAALGAQAGAVRLFDSRSQRLYLLVHDGLPQGMTESEAVLRVGECLCGEAVQSASSFVSDVRSASAGTTMPFCREAGFRISTGFTISFKKRLLGIYNLYFTEEREISPPEVHLLETLGQHLGVAVENQRLASRDRELAVSEERSLMAQELHDSIAQGLAFLNIQVQLLEDSLRHNNMGEAMETAGQIREGVQNSYDDVRELLMHFRTRVHQSDLESGIAASLRKFETQSGVRCLLREAGSGAPLPPEFEIQVLHIFQEALSNVRRHARASAVEVEIRRSLDAFTLCVRDDGVGFSPGERGGDDAQHHVGLEIMSERARRIGGRVVVSSDPGKGTEVRLSLTGLQKAAA